MTEAEITAAIKAMTFQAAEINPSELDFLQDVLDACKANYCGRYGTNWCCPPATGDLPALKAKYGSYKQGILWSTKHMLEDSYDVEGMDEARRLHVENDSRIMRLAGELKNAVLLGPGGCNICKTCTYPDAPCRFPEKAVRSLEGSGIQVYNIAKKAGMSYMNGQNTVTYFSLLLYGDSVN